MRCVLDEPLSELLPQVFLRLIHVLDHSLILLCPEATNDMVLYRLAELTDDQILCKGADLARAERFVIRGLVQTEADVARDLGLAAPELLRALLLQVSMCRTGMHVNDVVVFELLQIAV